MSENKRLENNRSGASRIDKEKLVKRLIVCVSVLVLLLFTLFSPFTFTRVEVDSAQTYRLKSSLLDGVRYFVASLFYLSDSTLAAMDYFYEWPEDVEPPSIQEQFNSSNKTNADFKSLYVATLMHHNSSSGFFMLANALINAAYLVFLAIWLVTSLLSLVTGLFRGPRMTAVSEWSRRKTERGLLAALLMLPLLLVSNLYTCNIGYSNVFFLFKTVGLGAGIGFYIVLILLIAVNAFIAREHIIESATNLRAVLKRVSKREIIATACVLLVMLSVLLPSISVSLTKFEDGRTRTSVEYVYSSDMAEFSSYARSYYKEFTSEYTATMIRDIMNDEMSRYESSTEPLNRILLKGYSNATRTIYGFIHVMTLFMLALSARILYVQVYSVLGKAKIKRQQLFGKITLALICATLFILCVVMVFFAKDASHSWTVYGVEYGILLKTGIGPILAFMSAVVACFAYSKPRKMISINPYDNPDISYAPYVVK